MALFASRKEKFWSIAAAGIVLVIAGSLAAWVVGLNARGLKNYWLALARASGAHVEDVSVRMVQKTRMGICWFKAPPAEVDKIVKRWGLVEIPAREIDASMVGGCAKFAFSGLESTSAQLTVENGRPAALVYDGLTLKPRISFYSEGPEKQTPPLKGNTTSSFKGMFYDAETGTGCADLFYPYG